jgi:hypothetical protein
VKSMPIAMPFSQETLPRSDHSADLMAVGPAAAPRSNELLMSVGRPMREKWGIIEAD